MSGYATMEFNHSPYSKSHHQGELLWGIQYTCNNAKRNFMDFPVGSVVKNPPANEIQQVQV